MEWELLGVAVCWKDAEKSCLSILRLLSELAARQVLAFGGTWGENDLDSEVASTQPAPRSVC